MADVGGLGDSQDPGLEGDWKRAWWRGLDPLSSAAAFPYWREAEGNTAG